MIESQIKRLLQKGLKSVSRDVTVTLTSQATFVPGSLGETAGTSFNIIGTFTYPDSKDDPVIVRKFLTTHDLSNIDNLESHTLSYNGISYNIKCVKEYRGDINTIELMA